MSIQHSVFSDAPHNCLMSKEIHHQAGLVELSPEQGGASSSGDAGACHWFVMRDLKRANAKQPAYKFLSEHPLRVFTPMTWRLCTEGGRRVRREVPFIPDLLFVHASREILDPIVDKTATLQYRWLRNTWREPMTVADAEMSRKYGVIPQTIGQREALASAFDAPTERLTDITPLLYQSGYLTIKDGDDETGLHGRCAVPVARLPAHRPLLRQHQL